MKIYNRPSFDEETTELLRTKCIELFLRDNPQFKDLKITDAMIGKRVVYYYLGWL